MDCASRWIDKSVNHWIRTWTTSALAVFEDKIKRGGAVITAYAHERIFEVISVWETEFIGIKCWIPLLQARLFVYYILVIFDCQYRWNNLNLDNFRFVFPLFIFLLFLFARLHTYLLV
jgi:hypothetical protein